VDEEVRSEVEMETSKLQTEMDRIKDESGTLASEYTAEKQRMEMPIQKLAEERDRAKAECRKQLSALERQLQATSKHCLHSCILF